MKKTAIALVAAATLLTGLSISAPASAASWNWGFSTPWFGIHHERSVSPRHFRGNESVRVGPFKFNTGLSLGRNHVDRCYAHYRSYNEWTDTYVTFSGHARRCRL